MEVITMTLDGAIILLDIIVIVMILKRWKKRK